MKLLIELAIKAEKPRELEERIVRLRGELRAPIPSRGQSSIDATTRVKEVIATRAIKCMGEEIMQYIFFRLFCATIRLQLAIQAFALSAGCLQVADGDDNGTQYAGYLGVFVNKCQGVGDVVVSQVYHRATHPSAEPVLRVTEYFMHGFEHPGRLLHPLQALSRVLELVGLRLGQQVLLGQVPQPESILQNGLPQS